MVETRPTPQVALYRVYFGAGELAGEFEDLETEELEGSWEAGREAAASTPATTDPGAMLLSLLQGGSPKREPAKATPATPSGKKKQRRGRSEERPDNEFDALVELQRCTSVCDAWCLHQGCYTTRPVQFIGDSIVMCNEDVALRLRQ